MERLQFICPNTDAEIDAGIETELETLLRIRQKAVRIRCRACGEFHQWRVMEAQLRTAA